MVGMGSVSTLHVVEPALVVRHLMGSPESAQDRIGARHQRILQLFCAGWCNGKAFACLIRDPDNNAEVTRFGGVDLTDGELRSIRLRGLRTIPSAIWHHPFPLETAAAYAAQEATLKRHLETHAAQAGWTDSDSLTVMQPARNQKAASLVADFHPPPPAHEDGTAPAWAPDPEAPPSHIRVFPGTVSYHGEDYRVTHRERTDSRDSRLMMEYRCETAHGARGIWLNDNGRIIACAQGKR